MTSSENLSFFSPEYSSPRMLPEPPTPPPAKPKLTPLQSHNSKNQILVPYTNKLPEHPHVYPRVVLRQPRKRPSLMVWLAAIFCFTFSVLLIVFGVTTLIIFLAVKPRSPAFDTPAANLNFVYVNSMQFLNGEFTFVANFSNPNKVLNVRFESLEFELYFSDSLIATQVVQPFSQRKGDVKLVTVRLISSLVYFPHSHALELQKQVLSNRVVYSIRTSFKVRFHIGVVHYSYWLHGRCQVEMTCPPNGFLITHNCRTKR